MSSSIRCLAIVTQLGLAGCQTAAPAATIDVGDTPPEKPVAARVAAKTVLPETFSPTLAEPPTRLILVPVGMLTVSEVTRPRAEVRSGPGVQFELADRVLPTGAPVMVFNSIGVWRKIVVMADGLTGWVHAQALAEPRLNRVPMRVDARRLPTVLATRDVDTIKEFPAQTARAAKVPRGAMFRSLMVGEGGTLVWLPETASVMWMSRKDVQ